MNDKGKYIKPRKCRNVIFHTSHVRSCSWARQNFSRSLSNSKQSRRKPRVTFVRSLFTEEAALEDDTYYVCVSKITFSVNWPTLMKDGAKKLLRRCISRANFWGIRSARALKYCKRTSLKGVKSWYRFQVYK